MLTFLDPYEARERVDRRSFLSTGALGLAGLSLPFLLRERARAAEAGAGGDSARERSVVLLFLAGGASHIETIHPNLDAPAPYRSVTGEVRTSIPGLSLGGTFPLLARHAGKLTVVRSFRHDVGDHAKAIVHVLSGGTRSDPADPRGFSMGASVARIAGPTNARSGLPAHVLLTAPEKDSQYRTERDRVRRGSSPGLLGTANAPYDPAAGGAAADDLELHVPVSRWNDRVALLRSLDRLECSLDRGTALATHDRFTRQAIDVLVRGAREAFDLATEEPALVERYDTSHFRVGNFARRPDQVRASTLGHQLLLARKLCESGARLVTVQSAGWDHHADGNNPGILDGMEMLGAPLDRAVSAFLEDVESRGLSERILLVITGDFGRTPKINTRGGRDHWAGVCPLILAGGGLPRGHVIGAIDRRNHAPVTDPISPKDLLATILDALFDRGALRLVPGLPREVLAALSEGRPIGDLS